MLSLKAGPQAKLANLERKPDLYLPYTRHVTRDVIALRSRALMTVIELEGISFETIDNEDLEIFQNQLNMLWRNVASDQLAVWTHMVRKRERHYPDGEFHSDFARELDAKYRTRMVGEELYRNRWFLTLIWVPARDPSAKFSALIRKVSKSRIAAN